MVYFLLTYKAELETAMLLLLAAAAWRWGAGPERAAASSLLVFVVVDPIYHWFVGRHANYGVVEVGHLVQDCIVGGFLVAIAMRANRFYTLWMAAFQLLAVLSHAGRSFSHSAAPLAYSILTYLPSYLLLVTLGIGILQHARHVRRWGQYRSWWNDCPPWMSANAGPRTSR